MEVSSGTYEPALVLISIVIAIAASYITLELVKRVAIATGNESVLWLVAGAMAMGCGIWSMHFVGMLAYDLDIPHEYDVSTTLLSLIIAFAASLFAIYVASRNKLNKIKLVGSGIILGLGIASMHYTGMAAMRMAAETRYDPVLFITSIVIAIVAATAALWIALTLASREGQTIRGSNMIAAVVMGSAICGMHYVGMAAAQYVPQAPEIGNNLAGQIDPTNNKWLAVAVSLSAIIILGFAHLTLFYDYKLTDRQRSEAQLAELVEQRTKELAWMGKMLDDSFNEIFIFSSDTLRFLQVNRGARTNIGYSMQELEQLTPIDLSPEFNAEQFKQLLRPLIDHEEERLVFETVIKRKDGSQYPVEARLQLSTSSGQPVFVAITEDISERKKLEAQLLQSQKLESIGQLAAGIAHEINTPIQFVGDNTLFLQEAFAEMSGAITACGRQLTQCWKEKGRPAQIQEQAFNIDEEDLAYLQQEVPKAISQSLDGIARIKTIVSAMKEFSHPGGRNKEAVDINHLIENTITVASNEWKYVASVETELDRSLDQVMCYPQELGQVVLNLIVNAAHAIEEKNIKLGRSPGVIGIQTRDLPEFVEVRVSDTGAGIPEQIKDKIFDPFFTTKEVGKGTGQGLAIAHATIVEKHHGIIEVESELDKGTVFSIKLPKQNGIVSP